MSEVAHGDKDLVRSGWARLKTVNAKQIINVVNDNTHKLRYYQLISMSTDAT